MQITLQNFSTLVRNMSASAQGAAAGLTDFTVGSATRAILEASASVALWLQFLILQVMTMCRLSTSTGADVDSWVGDFGVVRLPGVAASGSVTMSSLAPSQQSGVVPTGASVRSSDGSREFTVIADPTQSAWSTQAAAYLRPAGTASISVTVVSTIAGVIVNVQPGILNLLGQSLSGIDTVTNPNAFVNGVDAESDTALKARFANFLDTRSRATTAAVLNAIAGVQQGLTSTVVPNVDAAGIWRAGAFLVVVDDGTGTPSLSLLGSVAAAVEQVRPIGSGYAVVGPSVAVANVAMTISFTPGLVAAGAGGVSGYDTIRAAIVSAVSTYLGSLPIGAALAYSRLSSLAYAVSPAVANVSGLTLNGGTSDLGGGPTQVVRPGTISVA